MQKVPSELPTTRPRRVDQPAIERLHLSCGGMGDHERNHRMLALTFPASARNRFAVTPPYHMESVTSSIDELDELDSTPR
jgi:hypothetical protein